LEKVLESYFDGNPETSSTCSTERLGKIMAKYAEVGLPVNDKKSFDNATLGSFWGVQVDGKKGTVRPNESRMWPLVLVTLRVCSLGLVTIGLLRSMVGSYVSILCLRRRLMAGLNFVFDAIAASENDSQVLRLSGKLTDELFCLIPLSFCAVVNLRAQTLPTLRATDASDWGMAAVSCELPLPVAKEVQRHSLSRSVWSKLLPPAKAWLKAKQLLLPEDELPGGEVFDVHPFWEVLARCMLYKEEWRKAHPRAVHVNIGELRAHLLEESRLAVRHTSCRVGYALDSQVALGCLVKGRGSSKALNAELSKSIPVCIGSDLYSAYGFWPSGLNRADGPTRAAEPAEPDQSCPPWWNSLLEGEHADFDAWMNKAELLRTPDAAFPPECQPLDLRTGRRVRTEAWARPGVPDDARPAVAADCCLLCEEAVSILQSFSEKQVWWPKGSQRKFLVAGALDLYTGVGAVARALLRGGCPWVVTFEIGRGADQDLLDKGNQQKVLLLIQLKAVKVCGSALVCRSFSRAITPPVRCSQFPRGKPDVSFSMREKLMEGNHMADFQAEVHEACEMAEPIVFFWCENPDSSFLWKQLKFQKFASPHSPHVFRADYCRFGAPWRKRTRVGTNLPKLCGLRMLCKCVEKTHLKLRGQHPTLRIPWTLVAQPYPRGFAKVIASACLEAAEWSGPFSLAGCAKCTNDRIGEAANPGPRMNRSVRNFSLEQAPLQTFASLSLGEKQWDKFLSWAGNYVSGDLVQLFLAVPLFLAHAIRRFGDAEFVAGGSLLYYRHLVLAAQRKIPTLRPFASICWDLASRWEKAEPTRHRAPVPESLVEALVAVAWLHGWKRWCGITLVSFYGIARVGEVLRCTRGDLLLPEDVMHETAAAFVLLKSSKTMHRGFAKLQHLKISVPYVVKLLGLVYLGAARSEPLFPGSAQNYRRRWDFLLRCLQVAKELQITPGGLRGGGAVSFYRRGGNITDLLWSMRLRHLSTLESYLQEVGAISLLTDLPPESRHAVRSAAACFLHLSH